MKRVVLTYFKESGKYYTGAEYSTHREDEDDVIKEIHELRKSQELPGLSGSGADFFILVNMPEHRFNVPKLIMPHG